MTIEQQINEIHRILTTNDRFLDTLNIISFCIGLYNLHLNQKQIDNNSIMEELQKQDNFYFEKIIKQLDELKENKNDNK